MRCRFPTATLTPEGNVLVLGGTTNVGAGSSPNANWELINPDTWTSRAYNVSRFFISSSGDKVRPQRVIDVAADRVGIARKRPLRHCCSRITVAPCKNSTWALSGAALTA